MLVQTGHGIQIKYPSYMEIFILQGASDVEINHLAMQNLSPQSISQWILHHPTIATQSRPSVCIKFDRTTRMLDRWILEKPQLARGRATEQCCMARCSYEQWDDNAILGQDPVGPLAPLGGPEPLLHYHPLFDIQLHCFPPPSPRIAHPIPLTLPVPPNPPFSLFHHFMDQVHYYGLAVPQWLW